MDKTIAIVEISFPEGKRDIPMELKRVEELEDCDDDTVVVINLKNGDTYTGIFKGLDDDDDIMLSVLGGGSTIGLQMNWVKDYFEEVEETHEHTVMKEQLYRRSDRRDSPRVKGYLSAESLRSRLINRISKWKTRW